MNAPITPKFIFAPDQGKTELYIVHTQTPLAIIWVCQTIPAKLFIVECAIEQNEKTKKQLSQLLISAAEWYRKSALQAEN